ncbi:MAG: DedA family protein [Nitrospinota bacterium]
MEILHEVIHWIVTTVGELGYTGIVIMMFLESSFFPFPSEVVMIPAGYHAANGTMNLFVAVAMGILGSILGALFNYGLAVFLGKPFLDTWGRFVFLTREKLDKVDSFFLSHGEISTFTGRLIPVVRQYISFPAGLAGMNLPKFTLYTGIGAGIWCAILAVIGYIAGKNEDLIKEYVRAATGTLVVSAVLIVVLYIVYNKKKNSVLSETK